MLPYQLVPVKAVQPGSRVVDEYGSYWVQTIRSFSQPGPAVALLSTSGGMNVYHPEALVKVVVDA